MQPTTTFAWYPVITCHTWVTMEKNNAQRIMGRIHVCAHNSSMGVHVHYIHTYASVGSYTRGAGA